MTIRSLSDENEECKQMGYRNWVQWSLTRRGFDLRPDWEHPKGSLKAAVSWGRWYVKCPDKSCEVAYGIDENEPYYFCLDCMNVANDFKPYRVEFRNLKDLKVLLGKRKDYRQRNYLPHLGETHEHLEKENKKLIKGRAHGVFNTRY